MQQPLPPLTKALTEAFAASAVAWLVRLMRVLCAPGAARRRALLRRFVRDAERWVECVIFLKARVRQRPTLGQRRQLVVWSRPGFRVRCGRRSLFWKSARIRLRNATLCARILRLLTALAEPERYLAHYMKRLARGVWRHRLVACAPAAAALHTRAPDDIGFADSS